MNKEVTELWQKLTIGFITNIFFSVVFAYFDAWYKNFEDSVKIVLEVFSFRVPSLRKCNANKQIDCVASKTIGSVASDKIVSILTKKKGLNSTDSSFAYLGCIANINDMNLKMIY
ncbi:hypothetical protein TVAG_003300 [Trichomonas vaginalis G3]|uniref:Uncharacterized protein n=1 Tax=Trichomonas vaginalis (strain ATCC PRA-98 / G3) TaxID=412133 RepID=A2FN82_TRIV3|nr:hypothetical protein TVAG_003300 [Trichomonas vaginalis G3]|eukprot:XP_001306571.1 hypothetical protein [Trichomonas vaginalis G3]